MVLSNRRLFSMCQCQFSKVCLYKDPFLDALYLILSQSHSQAPYWRESGNETTSAHPPLRLSNTMLFYSTKCCLLHHQLIDISSSHNSTSHTTIKEPHTPFPTQIPTHPPLPPSHTLTFSNAASICCSKAAFSSSKNTLS